MALLIGVPPWATALAAAKPDLTAFSLEDLMDIEITSISKRPQRLGETAAAVFVITQEDIRRSGVSSLPDALRMAPGVHVSENNTQNWAVSIRGFNDRYSNKVLVDRRTVYSEVFSGVLLQRGDVVLEDIDRIEVVRGPGSSIWGANAVNGVINIITQKAEDTQGLLVSTQVGNEEHFRGALRYGGEVADKRAISASTPRIW